MAAGRGGGAATGCRGCSVGSRCFPSRATSTCEQLGAAAPLERSRLRAPGAWRLVGSLREVAWYSQGTQRLGGSGGGSFCCRRQAVAAGEHTSAPLLALRALQFCQPIAISAHNNNQMHACAPCRLATALLPSLLRPPLPAPLPRLAPPRAAGHPCPARPSRQTAPAGPWTPCTRRRRQGSTQWRPSRAPVWRHSAGRRRGWRRPARRLHGGGQRVQCALGMLGT